MILERKLTAYYKPAWELHPSGLYFIGYKLPTQEGLTHQSALLFDTESDLEDYVKDRYGTTISLQRLEEEEESGALL